jgi:hypothetical protein
MSASAVSSSGRATQTILGLVAGEGKLPAILAQSAADRGYKVIAFALSPEAAARVTPHCVKVHEIAPGQLGRNLKLTRDEGVRNMIFIGKVPKINVLRNLHKLDWMAVKELSKLPNLNDDTIQQAFGEILERQGVTVLPQRDFLRELFPDVGILTKRQPNAAEYADIDYGTRMAKEIARLDIGQTVVVKDRMILAIEAIEGTDSAIRRGVELARGPVVVVKVARVDADPRFDTPTIGLSTLESMKAEHEGGVLAITANETMVVDREEVVRFADANGISIAVV